MVVKMKQLLEAGVHFGHQTRRWNPKMAKYIFTQRNGIYIIDLQKTVKKLVESCDYISELIRGGGKILFVGTKKQAQESIEEVAKSTGMYYVNSRWLGGTLTNLKTIRISIFRFDQLNEMEENGTFNLLPKKEAIKLRHEQARLKKNLGGIKTMEVYPDLVFVVDSKKERNAVLEARKLGIPTMGIVDTNCDPDELDYPIPANDDAIRSVKLILSTIGGVILEAKQGEEECDSQENLNSQAETEQIFTVDEENPSENIPE